jgi:hypothetical protein
MEENIEFEPLVALSGDTAPIPPLPIVIAYDVPGVTGNPEPER